MLPVPGEVFALRKLMPQQPQYDFNIHVMDFQPGESLYVKVWTCQLGIAGLCMRLHCSVLDGWALQRVH